MILRELGETGLRGADGVARPFNLIRIMPAEGLVRQTAVSYPGDGFFCCHFPENFDLSEGFMMSNTILIRTVLILALVVVAGAARAERVVTLMTHDSFNVSEAVLAAFEKDAAVKVRVLKAGDAGSALVQAILAKGKPQADVFFGVDTTFLSRALAADIFVPYDSPKLADIASELQLDPQHRLLPVDYGDVCLNYDRNWFQSHKLAPPGDLTDLVKPAYAGLTVVENPATSSPGLAFLLATISRFGAEGYLTFWQQLRANKVIIANGWEDAYYGHFTAASKGDRPIVVSYASSPAAAVYYADPPVSEAPTAALIADQTAYRQIEFVGILKGAKEPELARKLVDFMLDRRFQEDIPLQMFVFPANRKALLPEVFQQHAKVAAQPLSLPPATIEANRERWLEEWTSTVLR